MNKVKILVDSTVDLTKELYEKYNFDVLPLNVIFGGDNFKDGVDMTPDLLYKRVKEFGELPRTAALAPKDFEDAFRKYLDQGYDIVSIGIGSGFSTCLQSANIAKQEFPEDRIFLVDSQNLSSGAGLLAMHGARMAEEGKSAKEIKEELDKLVPFVSSKFAVETLEYLHKGGRCSGASKLFGHIFHIHPIISVVNNAMIVTKKPRGLMKIAINEMVNELKADLPNVLMGDIMITHSGCAQDVIDYCQSEVAKLVDPKCIKVTRAGCVISTHCGPGTIGILYIKK